MMKLVNSRKLVMAVGLTGLLGLGACEGMNSTERNVLTGAGVGAAGGALLGGVTGGSPVTGAVIGGIGGAGAGYLYDKYKDRR